MLEGRYVLRRLVYSLRRGALLALVGGGPYAACLLPFCSTMIVSRGPSCRLILRSSRRPIRLGANSSLRFGASPSLASSIGASLPSGLLRYMLRYTYASRALRLLVALWPVVTNLVSPIVMVLVLGSRPIGPI